MATAAPTVPIEALDRLRIQLGLLNQSMVSLLQELRTSDPLPPWDTLTAQLAILNSQLSTLSRSVYQNSATLSSTVVYPLPNFPVRTHEGLLALLLRKKLAPEVEEWVQAGYQKGVSLTEAKQKNSDSDSDSEAENEDEEESDDSDDGMDDSDAMNPDGEPRKRNRHWALKMVQRDQRSRDWDSDFTKEEIEAVNGDISKIQTGLQTLPDGRIVKRSADSQPQTVAMLNKRDDAGYPLEAIFRFISTGVRPPTEPLGS